MNDFQKRALAYHAYRALRKLAAAQQEEVSDNTAESKKQDPPANQNKKYINNWAGKLRGINKLQGDYYRRIYKGNKGGCCGK